MNITRKKFNRLQCTFIPYSIHFLTSGKVKDWKPYTSTIFCWMPCEKNSVGQYNGINCITVKDYHLSLSIAYISLQKTSCRPKGSNLLVKFWPLEYQSALSAFIRGVLAGGPPSDNASASLFSPLTSGFTSSVTRGNGYQRSNSLMDRFHDTLVGFRSRR